MDELSVKIADYALAVNFMAALTFSVALTLMIKAATFPLTPMSIGGSGQSRGRRGAARLG